MPTQSIPTSLTQFGDIIGVNTTTQSYQTMSVNAALTDGRFVVAWNDQSQTGSDTSETAVRAQIFNADGSKSGDEFLVNTSVTGTQINPTITALAGGKFVVAWADGSGASSDTSDEAVIAQIFNADGTKSGGEFLVNTTTASDQRNPSITTLSDGKFVVSWDDYSRTSGDTSDLAVRAQIFNADGTPSGSEFVVNTITAFDQGQPAITALAAGKFAVTWIDISQSPDDDSGYAIRAQVFHADGSKSGDEFLVNTTTVSWQLNPKITTLSDGKFVITWQDSSAARGDTSFDAVRAQVFNADGSKSGGELLVNKTTEFNQRYASVTALSDGRFMVSWDDIPHAGNTPGNSIHAQIFNNDGTKSGGEVMVNLVEGTAQTLSTLTTLANDRVLVTYTDASLSQHDDSDSGIIGQFLQVGTPGQTLEGGDANDRFTGSDGDDIFRGLKGGDIIRGGRGADTLNGNIGRDQIEGGHGKDQINGGFGDDTLLGQNGDDTIRGGKDDDTINGGAGADSLYGDNGRDRLTGAAGNDTLKGGSGADLLRGGAGGDSLQGGTGRDVLFGGTDDDTFVFARTVDSATGANRDMIRDFAAGDIIDIRGIDAIIGNGTDDAFTFIGTARFSKTAGELRTRTDSAKTIVQGDIDGDGKADFEIGLSGIHALTAADFIL